MSATSQGGRPNPGMHPARTKGWGGDPIPQWWNKLFPPKEGGTRGRLLFSPTQHNLSLPPPTLGTSRRIGPNHHGVETGPDPGRIQPPPQLLLGHKTAWLEGGQLNATLSSPPICGTRMRMCTHTHTHPSEGQRRPSEDSAQLGCSVPWPQLRGAPGHGAGLAPSGPSPCLPFPWAGQPLCSGQAAGQPDLCLSPTADLLAGNKGAR